jgi:hypothetical protein
MMEKVNQRVEIRGTNEYHGDEDELAHERDQKEENDPRHEPNFDDKEGK